MTERSAKSYQDQIDKLIAYVKELEAEKEMQIAPGISVATVSADSALGKMLEKFEWMEKQVQFLEGLVEENGRLSAAWETDYLVARERILELESQVLTQEERRWFIVNTAGMEDMWERGDKERDVFDALWRKILKADNKEKTNATAIAG